MRFASADQIAFDLNDIGSLDFGRAVDFPAARRLDPETSKQAATSAKELQAVHVRLILACLKQHGALGKDGIASRTRLDGVQCCRRLSEMARAGLIAPTGRTVQSTAGRSEREWRKADRA